MFPWIEPGHGLPFLQLSMLSAALIELGAAGGGLYFLPSQLHEVMQRAEQLGGLEDGRTHASPQPHEPRRAHQPAHKKTSQRPPGPSCSSVIINFAAKAGDHYTLIPPPFCLLPTPTPRSPHAWIRYIPPALPDVSIPWSPDRAIIYQVVSRVVGEGGPGGRGFVSSLCWSSTGPSSLVSSQLLRVAGVREQMLKGLPFICRLILMPFHFILPASGMLLAYTPPHPPRYHSACMFSREQELIFHVLFSSTPAPQLLLSPAHSASVSVFSPLAFFSSLNVRYHKPNWVKRKSCSGSLSFPCKRFGVLQPFMLLFCMPGRWVTT